MRDLTCEEKEFFETLLKKNPTEHQGYMRYRVMRSGTYKSFKRSRIVFQLHLGKYLEMWEIVHHKDGNKKNDDIENLEVLNAYEHALNHPKTGMKRPEGWKPCNATPKEVIERIQEIAKGMIKINCSEISRRLESEGIKISSVTIKNYLFLFLYYGYT